MENTQQVIEDIWRSKTSASADVAYKSFKLCHQPADNDQHNQGYSLAELTLPRNETNSTEKRDFLGIVKPITSRPSIEINGNIKNTVKIIREDKDVKLHNASTLIPPFYTKKNNSSSRNWEIQRESTETLDLATQNSIIMLYKPIDSSKANYVSQDFSDLKILSSDELVSTRMRKRMEKRSKINGMQRKGNWMSCISSFVSWISNFCNICCSFWPCRSQRQSRYLSSAISDQLVSLSLEFMKPSLSLSPKDLLQPNKFDEVLLDSDEDTLFEDSVLYPGALEFPGIEEMDLHKQPNPFHLASKVHFNNSTVPYISNPTAGLSFNSGEQLHCKYYETYKMPFSRPTRMPSLSPKNTIQAIHERCLPDTNKDGIIKISSRPLTPMTGSISSFQLISLPNCDPIVTYPTYSEEIEIIRHPKQKLDDHIPLSKSLFNNKTRISNPYSVQTYNGENETEQGRNPQFRFPQRDTAIDYPAIPTFNNIKLHNNLLDNHLSTKHQRTDTVNCHRIPKHSLGSSPTYESTSQNSCESLILKYAEIREGSLESNEIRQNSVPAFNDFELNSIEVRDGKQVFSDVSLLRSDPNFQIQKSLILDRDSQSSSNTWNSTSPDVISRSPDKNVGGRLNRFSGHVNFGGVTESQSSRFKSISSEQKIADQLAFNRLSKKKTVGLYPTSTHSGKRDSSTWSRSVNNLMERALKRSHHQKKKDFFQKKFAQKRRNREIKASLNTRESAKPVCDVTGGDSKINPNFVQKCHSLVLEKKLYDPPISVDKFLERRTEPDDDKSAKTVKAWAYLSCFPPMFTTSRETQPRELDLHPGMLARLLYTPEKKQEDPLCNYSSWEVCSKGLLHFYRCRYSDSHCHYHLYKIWKEILEMGSELSMKLRNLLTLGNDPQYNIYDSEVSVHAEFFRLALNVFAKNILIGAEIGQYAVTLADQGILAGSKEPLLRETKVLKSFKNVINTHMDIDPTFDLEGQQLYDQAKLLAPCIFKYFAGYVLKFRGMKILYRCCRIHSRAHYYLLSDKVYDFEGSKQSKVSYLSAPMLVLNWLTVIFFFEDPIIIDLFMEALEADPNVEVVSIKNEMESKSLLRFTVIVKNLEVIGKPSEADMSSFFLEIRLQFFWKWFFKLKTFRLEHISRCEPEHLLRCKNILN